MSELRYDLSFDRDRSHGLTTLQTTESAATRRTACSCVRLKISSFWSQVTKKFRPRYRILPPQLATIDFWCHHSCQKRETKTQTSSERWQSWIWGMTVITLKLIDFPWPSTSLQNAILRWKTIGGRGSKGKNHYRHDWRWRLGHQWSTVN